MADIIQIRRDVSSRWTNINPVLAEGEFAVELDNLPFKLKMGNGLSSYNQLPYLITPARVILGADTLNLGDVYFSNANNVSFSLIGSSIQASASFSQSVQTQNLVTIQNSTGNISFINSNNISFGGSNGQITASFAYTQSTGPSAFAASNSTITSGTLYFSNANNVNFGLTNNSLTASVIQSVQPVAFSGSNGSALFSTLSFGNLNGLTFYTSNGSLVGSYSVPTDYVSSNQSSLFQQTSQMSDYLGANYTSHTHSQYLNTSQSSLFQQTSQMSDYALVNHTHSQYLNTSQSSLFQHTSATSNITSNALHSTSPRVFNILLATNAAGGGTASLSSNVSLGNLNGFTFYSTNGSIVGSYTTPAAQTVQPVAASGSNGSFNFSTLSFGASNGLTFYTTNGSIVGSYSVPTFNQSQQPMYYSAGGQSTSANTLQFGNSNGVTFSLSNGSVIGSVQTNYLTTAAQSNQTLAISLGGNSGTTNSSVMQNGGFVLAGGNNITLSQSNNTISIYGPAVGGGGITNINLSAGTTSNNLSNFVLDNANGISFGLNGSTITASHNGLTQQSTQPVAASGSNGSFAFSTLSFGNSNGLNFYTTNGSLVGSYTVPSQSNQNISLFGLGNTTQNSSTVLNASNLSFNAIGSLTVGFSNGSIQLSAPNALTSQSNQAFSGSNGSSSFQTISFGSSNGMNFYLTNGSLVGSYTVPSQTVQPVAASGSNGSFNFSTLSFGSSNGMHFYTTNGSVVGSYTVPSQTVQPVAASGSNGSFAYSTLSFGNLNGLSFYTSNGSLVASHNAVTSQTNQNISLYALGNTTQNSSTVLNASQLSLNGLGIITVGFSNGSIQLSATGGGGGVTPAASASNGSFNFTTLNFSNANNVTFGTSAGGIITASVAAPGAAAENNWFNLLGANTAGNTTVSGSTIGMSALNLTLSGTNGSQMVLSAPATSSLSATGQLSISVNGSTISMGVPAEKTYNIWEPLEMRNNTVFSAPGQNSIYIQKIWPQEDYSFGSIEQHASLSFVSSTNSQAVAYTWDYGVYARDTGTNSSRMTLSASSRMIFQASYNSNTAAGFTISGGGTSYTQTSAGTGLFTNITAGRHIYFPFDISLSAGGEYAVAWRVSSASTVGTSPLRMSVMVFTNINNLTWGKLFNSTISATNASFVEDFGQGVFSATSAAFATSYAESQLTNAVSRARQYLMFE